jgi:hypothetical protein
MSIIVKEVNRKSNPVPEGMHRPICTSIVDLGTQFSEKFGKSARKGLITWSLPDETIEIDGEEVPRLISRQFTLSLHKKAKLREMLESWHGRAFDQVELEGFDIVSLLGENCMLQILHNETATGVYANVNNVLPLEKKKWIEPSLELIHFSLDGSDPIPQSVPEWVRRIIEKSEEWPTFSSAHGLEEDLVDSEGEVLRF